MAFGRKTAAEKIEAARAIAAGFWGPTPGGPREQADVTAQLADLKLSHAQLGEVRVGLPGGGPGTTGDRVRIIDRILKRLEHQAAG